MASVVLDGLTVPVAVGGFPALDFCNTRAGWGAPRPKEYLHTHAHLGVWAAHVGLLPRSAVPGLRRAADADPAAADRVLRRALAFRDALYAALTGAGQPRDWLIVNREVRRSATASRLTPDRPSRWELHGDAAHPSNVEWPLLAVARAAADLLVDEAAAAVAACPGAGCGWLFADPRGRRRWCSMAWCGNRAKARRHADKHAGDPAPNSTVL